MHIAAIIEYSKDASKVKDVWPAHRQYLRTFLENGKLRAAGPFSGDAGALWILEVDNVEEADAIVKADPFVEAGAITEWKLRTLAYWSAKECRGAQ